MNENVKIVFGLLGGLALFLYGMNGMSDALQKTAGDKMKKILSFLTKNPIMGALAGALVIGRVIAGIVKALVFARGEITIASWATAYFVTCLPGIIMQIILVPVVFATLTKANLIPSRYVICEE